jgi:transposase
LTSIGGIKLDAVWLCKVAERQMIRPSFVPPPPIRRLRDLTRYRADLVAVRTAEKNRAEKLLEDAQIKMSVVASDIFGVSGRQMLGALIGGERDPKARAQLARGRMRTKIGALEEAFTGFFTDHHAFLLSKMVARVDGIDADIAAMDAKIEAEIAPFVQAVEKLDEIPGVNPTAAYVIIAEVGLDMGRFPTSGHLVSWAKFAPGVKESAGKKKGKNATGHGDPYLARVLGNAAMAVGRTDTFLGERYRRIARRRGKKKAMVAIGRSILVIIWHLLSDHDARFHDLGADFYTTRTDPERFSRQLNRCFCRWMNSANVVGWIPNFAWASSEIRDCGCFKRSTACSNNASAKSFGRPAASMACRLSLGVMLR